MTKDNKRSDNVIMKKKTSYKVEELLMLKFEHEECLLLHVTSFRINTKNEQKLQIFRLSHINLFTILQICFLFIFTFSTYLLH